MGTLLDYFLETKRTPAYMTASNTAQNILQYESTIWSTADLLRGCGIKESEWPSYMMPFFALMMLESRLLRMLDDLKAEFGEETLAELGKDVLDEETKTELVDHIQDKGQGYNAYIFEKHQTLKDICQNDKSFDVDFDAYLKGFDGETKDLLGVDAFDGEKFLDIKGVIAKLKTKKVLFSYVKAWSSIDLKPFDNSAITTLEEHIKRRWADISAETAGEQYTPADVIALIAEIIAFKIEDSDRLLKIYDCTCGGGNLLFGVEDRIKAKVNRLTQTFGQDWNDALYALAKIESRFRVDSKIEHGNTLTDDKFFDDEFDEGRTFADRLKEGKKSLKLKPMKLDNGERTLTEFTILNPPEPESKEDVDNWRGFAQYFTHNIKPFVSSLDCKEQPLVVTTEKAKYSFDTDQETLIKEVLGKREALGCGKIEVKSSLKKKTKTKPESIEITVELTPDYQGDYEIIPFHRDPDKNQAAIDAFMAKYITKPFKYLENCIGVQINFNKVFYKPEQLRSVEDVQREIASLNQELRDLEQGLSL